MSYSAISSNWLLNVGAAATNMTGISDATFVAVILGILITKSITV